MLRKIIFTSLMFYTATVLATEPVVDIKTWQTSNGAKVMYVYLPELPMVDISVTFAAGSAHDGNNHGIAYLTNTMLNEGTQNNDADAQAEAFESVGAVFGTSVGRDQAKVNLRSLTDKQYLTPALNTFTDVLTYPNFPKKNFKRVQDETLMAIKESNQNPSAIASRAFYQLVYGNYPYGHPVYGDTQTIDAAVNEQAVQFFKKYYVGNNALIAIAGNVDRQSAESIANQLMAKVPDGTKAASLEPPSFNTGSVNKHIQYPATQTYIRIGNLGTKYNDPINYPLDVGNYILGGRTLVSRLFTEVREKRGLSYNVGSSFNSYKENGTFVISLQARSGHASQAITVSNDVLQQFINTGPTEMEVKKAKQGIIDSFPNQLQGNGRILSAITQIGFYNLPLDYLDSYREKIMAITLDDVNHAFKKTVKPKQMITVTVGPEADKTSQAAQAMSDNAMVAVKW